jgi:NTE family protein
MNNHTENDIKFGLTLGSGSARGLSHIGVIHALEEAGIKDEACRQLNPSS